MRQYFLRLVYASNATSEVNPGVLDAILQTATRHNSQCGITGVLCSGPNQFLQVIEGPERQVLDLYTRITADPRHRDAALLHIELGADRMFPQWSMGHVRGPASVYGAFVNLRHLDDGRKRTAEILRACLAELRGST